MHEHASHFYLKFLDPQKNMIICQADMRMNIFHTPQLHAIAFTLHALRAVIQPANYIVLLTAYPQIICIFNADCTHWFRYSLSLATACSYLRSSSCISRLKTTMYSPSIAVGVSTLNRGAVQWKKEKDAAKELNLKACNAWKLLDRQTFQVFAVCKCAGCNSENDSCNLHVWIPRETAE